MARRYTLDGRLGEVRVGGSKLTVDVAERVTSASVSLSSSEVTQFTMALVEGDDFPVLRSGIFLAGTPTSPGSSCDYAGLALEVRAIELAERGSDHVLTITARSAGAGRMRRARSHVVRRDLSPTEFVRLEAKAAGLAYVGQPSARRKTIARKADKGSRETSWDTCQRLAEELGYLCFEVAGTLYFARPTWLAAREGALAVAWAGRQTSDDLDKLPRCRRSGDDKRRFATVELETRGTLGNTALPGMGLVLAGVPTFDGRYMVDTVTIPLAESAPVTIGASTPTNPVPEPPPKKKKTSPKAKTDDTDDDPEDD